MTVLPNPNASSNTTPNAQAVAGADQFEAALGQLINATGGVYSGSLGQQLTSLIGLAQQDAETLQTYPAFDQGVTTFLDYVLANGLVQSPLIQQQIIELNSLAASGQTTSAEAQGLLWFLNNALPGGLNSAPFDGSTVTNIQATANGTVWFTCANGSFGYTTNSQAAVPVTLNGTPVSVASIVIGPDGTAWFATTGGQPGYCPLGQSAATLDPVARFIVTAYSTSSGTSTDIAGTSFDVYVSAVDAAGNFILDYPGTIQLSSSDPLTGLPISYTFVPSDEWGHVFLVTFETAGTQTVTATAGPATGQASVQITPAAVAGLAIIVPSVAYVGVGFPVTVEAVDAYGNVVTSYSGPVTLKQQRRAEPRPDVEHHPACQRHGDSHGDDEHSDTVQLSAVSGNHTLSGDEQHIQRQPLQHERGAHGHQFLAGRRPEWDAGRHRIGAGAGPRYTDRNGLVLRRLDLAGYRYAFRRYGKSADYLHQCRASVVHGRLLGRHGRQDEYVRGPQPAGPLGSHCRPYLEHCLGGVRQPDHVHGNRPGR